MHRTVAARCLNRSLSGRTLPSSARALCSYPVTSRLSSVSLKAKVRPQALATFPCQTRQSHAIASQHVSGDSEALGPQDPGKLNRRLPINCSGCGAFSQTSDPKELGFFDLTSKRVQNWLHPKKDQEREISETEEDLVISEALKSLSSDQLEALGLDKSSLVSEEAQPTKPVANDKQPVCDRCHALTHHGSSGAAAAAPMFHPTVDSLRETIEESPFKYNHIYHVIDAADFPMSLIPRLNVLLGDIPLRTRNRRSRSAKYIRDRKIDLSFIITRGDLLGPTKENVDRNMPYLREVLREALGRIGHRIRLGNVSCVSAKRGWWTKKVREDIWSRGGANWMVGKVNVGKSQLFEAVYPKGRVVDQAALRDTVVSMYPRDAPKDQEIFEDEEDDRYKNLNVAKLLPPAQPLKQYPEMPMVSSLPGTTASPIRIPFGNGKGELVDLPGLARGDLELFVKPEHRQGLIMKSRIVPEQVNVKPDNSLLLGGGLIRITPRTPGLTFLMYNFTPLKEHLTNNEKAVEFQNQTRVSPGVENITLPGVGEKMQHAGSFKLRYDVTRRRAGPLTNKDAVGLKVEQLPFRVLSLDILIEGVGYVEVVAQMHAKALEPPKNLNITTSRPVPEPAKQETSSSWQNSSDDPFERMMEQRRGSGSEPPVMSRLKSNPVSEPEPEQELYEPPWPVVDVFTPEGRFVGSRKPIEGWLNNKPLLKAKHKRGRPRRSMKGQKKKEKTELRAYD
ncbi:unnamed protein product [Clonostachys byssicola]|uniref:Genetic interactor of prohibitins 3 n=1 Tax=Clonostachys byssicola TaxID=160290 RepID=A0A9N9UW55_9HYPO|nr:unnamed protein product [Clonostachys byssicola]